MSLVSHFESLDLISLETFGCEEFAPTLPFPVKDVSQLYAHGRFGFGPLVICVDFVKGQVRSGVDPKGVKWSTTMPCAYGDFYGTKDADGEAVDVYINQTTFSLNAPIFVLDQLNPDTGDFDEHKCFLGYATQEAALADYAKVVPNSEKRIGGMVSMSLGDFCKWVVSDETLKPVEGNPNISPATKMTSALMSKEVIKIPSTSVAPKVVVRKNDKGVDIEIYILSEFQTGAWGPVTNTIIDLIENAGEDDTVLIGISSYGGELDLAARIASVIRETKAKVTTLSLGPVASAGCLVWCEGHERWVSAGSFFMQHEAGCELRGKTSQIAKMALVTSEYVKRIIFPKAMAIGLFTDGEIDSMVDKGTDIFISAREAARRTGAEIV